MPNAIKELLFGNDTTQYVPIDGFVTITLGADLGSVDVQIDFDYSQGDVVSAFELVPAIGADNVAAEQVLNGSMQRVGWKITLQGALANTAIDLWTVMSSLVKAAGNVTIGGTAGVADIPVTPTLTSPYVSRVQPVNGIQQFDFSTCSPSDTVLIGGSSNITIGATDADTQSSFDTAMTFFWGAGNYSIANSSAGVFRVTIGGVRQFDTPALLSVSAGSSSFFTENVPGVYQQDQITYPAVPTAGSAPLNYGGGHMPTINAGDSNATIQGQFGFVGSASVSGDFVSGHLITFNDNGSYGAFSGSISTNSLVIAGTKQAPTFATTGSPTSGSFVPQADGGDIVSAPVPFDATGVSFQAALSGTFALGTASGSTGGPWTVTSPSAAANQTITVRANTLGVDLGAVMDEVQAGQAASGSAARNRMVALRG